MLAFNCGVKVPRTSCKLAKALTIKLTGEVTLCATPACDHCVFIDKLSLPTGMETPKAGHNSRPTAFTVS